MERFLLTEDTCTEEVFSELQQCKIGVNNVETGNSPLQVGEAERVICFASDTNSSWVTDVDMHALTSGIHQMAEVAKTPKSAAQKAKEAEDA